ncbi:hypothetical protein [Halorarius litoreus]|uniref:hypothetical protein n=1 Tax=Halorarius litoreus TaxID=2962676 RepID=UPI0020CB93B7|nr:hypothetical protein [Halorarius litoreus]
MYPLRFLLVLVAALVGTGYVLGGFACYRYGHRRDHTRALVFGRTVVTFAPAPLLAAVVGFFVQLVVTGSIILGVVGLLVVGGVLVPPARGVVAVFDDAG